MIPILQNIIELNRTTLPGKKKNNKSFKNNIFQTDSYS